MRIVVLDGYTLNPGDNPWDAVSALGELTVYDRTQPSEVVERAKEADVVLTNKTPLDSRTLGQLEKLKFISVLATGFNVVDVEAARARNIPVSNVPEYGTDTVAQHVFAVLLTLCHRPTEHDAAVRAGEWQARGDFCFWKAPLTELAGLTMGVIGFGRIGRRTAELAHAMGMRVLAFDPYPSNAPDWPGFEWRDVASLCEDSDVVTLHCPQTKDNTGMVDGAFLGRMKKSGILINAARGGLVNERDLAEALKAGVIAGACIDVVSKEPIEDDNPLLGAPNCLLTPHIAWATQSARRRLMATTAGNIAAFQAGRPVHVVNG